MTNSSFVLEYRFARTERGPGEAVLGAGFLASDPPHARIDGRQPIPKQTRGEVLSAFWLE
jgi:hypothetical protein